jgi:hypothetical protein
MVVSTDLPLLEAALVLLPVAYKQLSHLELKNTLLQPVLIFLHILVTSKLSQMLLLLLPLLLLLKLKKLFSQHYPHPSQMG